jgi:hypothetical protein
MIFELFVITITVALLIYLYLVKPKAPITTENPAQAQLNLVQTPLLGINGCPSTNNQQKAFLSHEDGDPKNIWTVQNPSAKGPAGNCATWKSGNYCYFYGGKWLCDAKYHCNSNGKVTCTNINVQGGCCGYNNSSNTIISAGDCVRGDCVPKIGLVPLAGIKNPAACSYSGTSAGCAVPPVIPDYKPPLCSGENQDKVNSALFPDPNSGEAKAFYNGLDGIVLSLMMFGPSGWCNVDNDGTNDGLGDYDPGSTAGGFYVPPSWDPPNSNNTNFRFTPNNHNTTVPKVGAATGVPTCQGKVQTLFRYLSVPHSTDATSRVPLDSLVIWQQYGNITAGGAKSYTRGSNEPFNLLGEKWTQMKFSAVKRPDGTVKGYKILPVSVSGQQLAYDKNLKRLVLQASTAPANPTNTFAWHNHGSGMIHIGILSGTDTSKPQYPGLPFYSGIDMITWSANYSDNTFPDYGAAYGTTSSSGPNQVNMLSGPNKRSPGICYDWNNKSTSCDYANFSGSYCCPSKTETYPCGGKSTAKFTPNDKWGPATSTNI